MKKRILSLLLVFCFCASLIKTFPVKAVEYSKIEDFKIHYRMINDNEAAIYQIRSSYTSSLSAYHQLPSTYNGYPVTTIMDEAFVGCNTMKGIIIPSGVRTIGEGAFRNCKCLEEVTLPDSVTEIGDNAFSNCTKLKTLNIPQNIQSIGYRAFYGTAIENISLPDHPIKLGENPYAETWYAKDSKNREDGFLYVGKHLITTDTSKSGTATIKEGTLSIADYALKNCTQVKKAIIPDSVEIIGANVFSSCTLLNEVTIPKSVKQVGKDAFLNCSILGKINIADIGAWCSIKFENEYATPFKYSPKIYLNDNLITRLEIPSTVTEIGSYAFCNNTSLSEVVIPASVTAIGSKAFDNCSGIKYVFYTGDEAQWNNISIDSYNTKLTGATVFYNASEKTYKFETNNGTSIPDVTGYMVPSAPNPVDDDKVFTGWYDNAEFSGNALKFPYGGEATTLYAKWRDKNGTSFDEAIPTFADNCYTVSTNEPNQTVYYKFIPEKTDNYRIFSGGDKNISMQLYDANRELLKTAEDGGEGNNFLLVKNLTAGECYYIAVTNANDAGEFTLNIKFNHYMVKFVADDGTVVMEADVTYGTPVFGAPQAPVKEPDAQYTYTFDCWEGFSPPVYVTENLVFKAKYTGVVNQYTYKFVNEDGTVILEKTVDYGTQIIAPEDPEKQSTEMYTYSFSGWEGYSENMAVTENATFTAKFEENIKQYTYKFISDGNVVFEKTVDYGTEIIAPEDPAKDKTAQFTYTFAGWDGFNPGMKATSDITFTAMFTETLNRYTYKFTDDDGTLIFEATADYGTEIKAPESISKPATQQYAYSFAGWEGYREGMTVTGDATFVAKYNSSVNQYTYKFVDVNGVVVFEKTVDYGTKIEVPKNPQKPSTQEYTYTFVEWKGYSEGMKVTENVSFEAVYSATKNRYKYKFIGEDGKVILENTVDYGTLIPKAPKAPQKPATQQYTYSFEKWEGYVENFKVTEDVVFTAKYSTTVNQYTYKFVDENGEVICENTVDYGTTIIAPTPPKKPATQQYSYSFDCWNGYSNDMVVTDNVTFSPKYTQTVNKYTCKFLDDDGRVISENTADYGTVITAPQDPSKPATQQYTYSFAGWDGYAENTVLTEDICFTAKYSATVNQYTYKFVDQDGKTVCEDTVDYGTVITSAPEIPFKGVSWIASWDSYTEGMSVTHDETFLMTYTPVDYTVFIGGTQDSAVVTYSKLFHIDPPVKEGYKFIGYFEEPDSNGKRFTNENGDSYEAYLVDDNSTYYPYFVPVNPTENQISFDGPSEVFIGKDYGIKLTTTVKNSYENGEFFKITVRYPSIVKSNVSITTSNSWWQYGKKINSTTENGYTEDTYSCKFKDIESDEYVFEIMFPTKEPMEARNLDVRIINASITDENDATVWEYDEKFVCNVLLKHHPIEAMEISGPGVISMATIYSVNVTPSYADSSVVWSVSDESVAWIDENGTVWPSNDGSVVITAHSTFDDTVYATKNIEIKLPKPESLVTNTGIWDKPFDPELSSYTVYLEPDTKLVTVTPAYVDGEGEYDVYMRIDGQSVESGTGKNISLLNTKEKTIYCSFGFEGSVSTCEYKITFKKSYGICARLKEDKSAVDVDLVDAPENTVAIVGYIKDKKIVTWGKAIYNGETLTFDAPEEGSYDVIKVLAWRKLEKLAPVFPAATITMNE